MVGDSLPSPPFFFSIYTSVLFLSILLSFLFFYLCTYPFFQKYFYSPFFLGVVHVGGLYVCYLSVICV